MQLIIQANGSIRCLYDEAIDLASLGHVTIQRASHVDADPKGHWHADLSPVSGPNLGPFECRSQALSAEENWLVSHWL